MVPGEDPARGFGFLQYASTCFLVAFGLSWGLAYGIGHPDYDVLLPLIEILNESQWFREVGSFSLRAIMSYPVSNFLFLIATWPGFVFLRNRAAVGGNQIVFGGAWVVYMIYVVLEVVARMYLGRFFELDNQVWQVIWLHFQVRFPLSLIFSLAFWLILRFWLWRQARKIPDMAETFR